MHGDGMLLADQYAPLTSPSSCHLPAVDLLINERQVVTREVRGGYYHPFAYLMSKLTLDASECSLLAGI